VGNTIDFMLSPKRDLTAARLFLRLALSGTGRTRPRVINVDGHPAYARAIAELKQSGHLGRRCRCRPSPYLNNIIEQAHRFIKKRIAASLGFRSAEGAWRSIEGYEAMHRIRKGQIRWRRVIHSGKSCAESVEVDSGLASEGVHGSVISSQKREGFRDNPLPPKGTC
jgi:transposase-like protein